VATWRPPPRPPHPPPLHSHQPAALHRPECGDARRRRPPPPCCRGLGAVARRCLPSRHLPRHRASTAAVAATSWCLPVRCVLMARRHCSKMLARTPYGSKPPGCHFSVCSAGGHRDVPRAQTKGEKGLPLFFFFTPLRHRNSSSLDPHGCRDSSDRLWCTSGRLLDRHSAHKARVLKYSKELDITPVVRFNHSNISRHFHVFAPC